MLGRLTGHFSHDNHFNRNKHVLQRGYTLLLLWLLVRNGKYERVQWREPNPVTVKTNNVKAAVGVSFQVCAHWSSLGYLLGDASIFSAAPRYISSPKKVFREDRYRERSPVHLLLTAAPDDLAAGPSASPKRRLSTRKVGSPEGAAAALQISKPGPIYWSKGPGWVSSQPVQRVSYKL